MKILLTINENEVSEEVKGNILENIYVLLNEVDDNFGNVKLEELEG